MSFDDDDSKIRRNLVAYSFAVIASGFFQISFLDLLKGFVSGALTDIPNWKAMAAGLSVLLYLMVRYRWSEPYVNHHRELNKKMSDRHIEIRREYLDKWARRFNSRKSNWLDNHFFPMVATMRRDLEDRQHGWFDINFKLTRDTFSEPVLKLEGDAVDIVLIRHYHGGTLSQDKIDKVKQTLPFPRLLLAIEWVRVRYHAILYSRGAVDITLPQIFAMVALGLLVSKVVFAYVN